MTTLQVWSWIPVALDAGVLGLLALLLLRSLRDPDAAAEAREARLAATVADLRVLIAQAEGQARDLDEKLAAYEERFDEARRAQPVAAAGAIGAASRAAAVRGAASRGATAPLGAAAAAPATASAVREPQGGRPPSADGASVMERVRQLAEARVPVEEIARRVSVPLADVRVLAGLIGARASAASARSAG